MEGCSGVLIPVLKFICNLSLSQQIFSTLWKQAAIVPISTALVNNYRPVYSEQFFHNI